MNNKSGVFSPIEIIAVFYICLVWSLLYGQSAHAQTNYPAVPDTEIETTVFNFLQGNDGQFGNGYGTDNNPNGYGLNINVNDVANSPADTTITPALCSAVYKLSYQIYDVDYDGEVRVYINNVYTAFVLATGEGLTQPRKIEFCGSLLQQGNNLIEFRVENSDRVWGVKDILLKYRVLNSVNLNSDLISTNSYGNGFGTNQHPDHIVFNFSETQDRALNLFLSGWDIDRSDELSVFFNDNFIGYLASGCNECLNAGDIFELDTDTLRTGQNQLLFIPRRDTDRWGIADLRLSPKFNIAPVILLLNQ